MGVVAAVALPAQAAPVPDAVASGPLEDASWWWDAMGVDDLHRAGTGAGVTVAVVDTPINPGVPELAGRLVGSSSPCLGDDGTRRSPSSTGREAEHGTSMAALIAGSGRGTATGGDGIRGIAPDARLLHYAVSYPDPADADETTCAITGPGYDEVADGVVAAIRQAVADGATIINLSLAGGYDADYAPALLEAYRAGVILVAGTSNSRREVLWPANGNGVVAVNPVDREGLVYDDSVTDAANIGLAAPGEGVNSFGWDGGAWHSDYRSDGSSNATALVSGGLAAMWSAHPDATANQVLQAAKAGVGLRRTADGVQTWFRRDGEDLPEVTERNRAYGWGIFDPADAVAIDPTTLPDENPFVVDTRGAEPSLEQIRALEASAPPSASASPTASPTTSTGGGADSAAPTTADPAGPPWVLVAVVALAPGGSSRRGRPRRPPPPRLLEHRGRPRPDRDDRRRGRPTRRPRRWGGMTMVQVHDGGGSGRPDLPAQAGPNERTLYDLYDFQTAIVSYTASQWKTTASDVTELSASVRRVVRELRNAPDGGQAWSGDAANAAYDSLGRLAANLDTHAEEIARIESGLTLAGDAVVDARTAYVTTVRTVSLDVDEQDFMRTPFRQPSGPVADLPATLDQQAYDSRDGRRQGAARGRGPQGPPVLRRLDDRGDEEAPRRARLRPGERWRHARGRGWGRRNRRWWVDAVRWRLRPTQRWGPAWPGSGTRPDGRGPRRAAARADGPRAEGPRADGPRRPAALGRARTGARRPRHRHDRTRGRRTTAVRLDRLIGDAGRQRPGRRGRGGRHGWHARRWRRRRAHGAFGWARWPRCGSPGCGGGRLDGRRPHGGRDRRRPDAAPARVAAGRSTILPGGGQGAAGRAGSGRGAAGGSGRTGRYGVPQLGERGGKGAGAAGAGAAGGRRGARDEDGQDVDHLTSEDEETWFEGAEDATPPVWE